MDQDKVKEVKLELEVQLLDTGINMGSARAIADRIEALVEAKIWEARTLGVKREV